MHNGLLINLMAIKFLLFMDLLPLKITKISMNFYFLNIICLPKVKIFTFSKALIKIMSLMKLCKLSVFLRITNPLSSPEKSKVPS